MKHHSFATKFNKNMLRIFFFRNWMKLVNCWIVPPHIDEDIDIEIWVFLGLSFPGEIICSFLHGCAVSLMNYHFLAQGRAKNAGRKGIFYDFRLPRVSGNQSILQ